MTAPDDGLVRCDWAVGRPDSADFLLYRDYHDKEWGQPLHGRVPLFERMSLEAFQSGLSWLIILRKRANFRLAFSGFEPAVVAGFGADDVARLLQDEGIVRNRAKIEAVIGNARALLELPTGLADLVWSYADRAAPGPATTADIPAATPASKALSVQLRKHGFRFTGPVTAYATMQACGVVNDHLLDCFRRNAYPA